MPLYWIRLEKEVHIIGLTSLSIQQCIPIVYITIIHTCIDVHTLWSHVTCRCLIHISSVISSVLLFTMFKLY